MANLQINEGIKFTVGDGTNVIGTGDPSGLNGIIKQSSETGFYIMSSVDYTLNFYDGSSWSAYQSIDVSDPNYNKGFAFAWEDNTAAYIKTADASHRVDIFGRSGDLKVDSTPGDANQGADSIVDGSGSLSITSINAQNYYTEALSVDNSGTVTFDRTDNNSAYQLKFEGTNITIGKNGDDTITLTGGDEFTSPLTTDGDLFIQGSGSDTRLGIGSDGQYLSVSSGAPAWVDFAGSPWTDETDWLSYNNDHAFVEIRAQHANNFNTTKNFTTGNLLIGDGMTLGGYNHRGNIYYGENHNLGASGIMMNNLIGGRANVVGDANYGVAIGLSNGISGDYGVAIGQANSSHGTHTYSIGYFNKVGTTSSDRTKSFAFGTNNTVIDDKQMALGFGVSTQWSSAEGVFFNAHTTATQSTAGFVKNPDGGPVNFGMGGRNVFEDSRGIHEAGAGAGVFWFHNFGNSRTVEPSTTISDAVAMYSRERASGKMGIIVRAENGGKTWIGDRIGINDTAPAASLEINGEGSTSATSSFKVNNSGGSTLFEVKDDGTVQANGGSLLGAHSSGALELMNSTSSSLQNTFGGTIYAGTVLVSGYSNKLDGGARASIVGGSSGDYDVYVDSSFISGNSNKAPGHTDSTLGTADNAFKYSSMIGQSNIVNGSGMHAIGSNNSIFGRNYTVHGNFAFGYSNKIGETAKHARQGMAIGYEHNMRNHPRRTMAIGFGCDTYYCDGKPETQAIITFGTTSAGATRPYMGIFADPANMTKAPNFVMGGSNAVRYGTTYPNQDGVGSGCFIFHNNSQDTVMPSANVPDSVSLFIADSVNSAGNVFSGSKGLIIKGELDGMSIFSQRIGVNVTKDTTKTSQINEEIQAGLHIFGEGNSDATSSVKVENSDGNVAIEVLNDLVVVMPNLPTSSAGLPTGALYNDGGTVKVA